MYGVAAFYDPLRNMKYVMDTENFHWFRSWLFCPFVRMKYVLSIQHKLLRFVIDSHFSNYIFGGIFEVRISLTLFH